jgi:heme-degrading monooxygenase HmoA
MVFVSLTRLRLNSTWRLPRMAWNIVLTMRQTTRASGFLGGRVLRDAHNTFWTITMWDNEKAMRAYRGDGAHKRVMPHLKVWCDEAAVAHWTQEDQTLPDWGEAHRRLGAEGRLSPVNKPTDAHKAKEFAAPVVSVTRELPLQPRKAKAASASNQP